jgi:hypothetical protein
MEWHVSFSAAVPVYQYQLGQLLSLTMAANFAWRLQQLDT